jgi:hypothetical protein
MKTYTVHAVRDTASGRWLTDGEGEIAGLVCETASFEELLEVIGDVAPDLVCANLGARGGEAFAVRIVSEHEIACTAA